MRSKHLTRVPRWAVGRGRMGCGAAALGALTVLAACSSGGGGTTASVGHDHPSSTAPTRSSVLSTALPTGDADAAAPAPAATSSTSAPTEISIPSIGVNSHLQALGLNKDGSLQSPSKWQVAGWYADGIRPGDPGPAVIAGHVDSVNGPAVFYRLTRLKPGETATVTQRNGHRLTFVVDTVNQYPKNRFPTAAVYGPTALPVLRLITCTGDFDRAAHSYVDNLVVTAHLKAPTPLSALAIATATTT